MNSRRPLASSLALVALMFAIGCAGTPAVRPHVRAGRAASPPPVAEPSPTASSRSANAAADAGNAGAVAATPDVGRPRDIAPAGWRYPLPDFRSDSIISHFGAPRDGGTRRHEGIDILAPKGTPVLAPVAGKVIASRKQSRGGNIVVLVGEGTEFVFAHLDKRKVSAGDWVQAGQRLGTVGNTGNARGMSPHLHFEVHLGSRAVDPYPLLTGGS